MTFPYVVARATKGSSSHLEWDVPNVAIKQGDLIYRIATGAGGGSFSPFPNVGFAQNDVLGVGKDSVGWDRHFLRQGPTEGTQPAVGLMLATKVANGDESGTSL